MPRYDYECESCGLTFEGVSSVAKRREVHCPDCGGKTYIVFLEPPQTVPDWQPYMDNGMGKWVKGKSDRREKMKQLNLREVGNDDIRQTRELLAENAERKRDSQRESN